MRKFALVVVATMGVAMPLDFLTAQVLPPDRALSSVDYEVAATVLRAVYPTASNKPVMVATQVATFACNPPIDNGFSIGGCSGMRSADITPEGLMDEVRAAIPAISPELAKKLLDEGNAPVALTHALPVNVPQFLYGKGAAEKPSGQPELAFYMSRPAIAEDASHALIYVGIVSWRDQSQSLGRYFYLEKSNGHWVIKGQVVTWRLGT